jgi:hypothetical protein
VRHCILHRLLAYVDGALLNVALSSDVGSRYVADTVTGSCWFDDLQHFLDLGPQVSGPALKLAEHLHQHRRAASAEDAHTPWETAPPYRRRPTNRRCLGRIMLVCADPDQAIGSSCSHYGDEGTISNWAGSIHDLRRQQLTAAQPRLIIIIADTAAALRTLPFLENDCQRAVFAIRGLNDELHLALTDIELDELIDALAAESNHEPNRRSQRQLDNAYDALTAASDRPRW